MVLSRVILTSVLFGAAVSQEPWVDGIGSDDALALLQTRSRPIHKSEGTWAYSSEGGELGPERWAEEYPACAGSAQSPINIPKDAFQIGKDGGQPLEYSYVPLKNAIVKNNGQFLQVDGRFGDLRLPDGVYEGTRFQIHCPSEHTLGGEALPCEMHIIHQKQGSEGNEDLAVVSIFADSAKKLNMDIKARKSNGKSLAFFRNMGLNGNQLPAKGATAPMGLLDLGDTFRAQLADSYYHYRGSLTTPPCSESVHWYIMKKPAAITEQMITTYKALFPNPMNARPVQDLGPRIVESDEVEVNSDEFGFADQSEFHWTYAEQGKWADGFPVCAGNAQSPVDITGSTPPPHASEGFFSRHVHFHETAGTGLQLTNNGHSLQVDGDFGTLTLPDGVYLSKRLSFHFPSEHKIDGKNAAGEMHIVHQKSGSSGTDNMAIIAILIEPVKKLGYSFEAGLAEALFRNLGFGGDLPLLGESKPLAKDDLAITETLSSQLGKGFYHYQGSLTSPPCSEGVHWYVMKTPAAMSKRMIDGFKEVFPNPANNRVVQPLNGRPLTQQIAMTGEYPQP